MLAPARAASVWKEQITSAGNKPRRVWKTVDNILGDAESGAKPNIKPDEYHDFIDKKVRDVQAATASAGCPKFVNREAFELSTLQSVSVEDVIKAIKSSSSKQCATDSLPTWLLRDSIAVLARTSRLCSTHR